MVPSNVNLCYPVALVQFCDCLIASVVTLKNTGICWHQITLFAADYGSQYLNAVSFITTVGIFNVKWYFYTPLSQTDIS